MELNWATPWCFLKAACSLPGSCPSRAGRYGSSVSSLRGQVWIPAASAARPETPGPEGASERLSQTTRGPNACPLPYNRLLAPLLRSSPCSPPGAESPTPFGGACWGCSAKTYQITVPQGQRRRRLPGCILIGNEFGVRLLSLEPLWACTERDFQGPCKIYN